MPLPRPTAYRVLGLVALALAVLAASCSADATTPPDPTATDGPTASPAPTSAPAERYQRLACPFDVPSRRIVECGYLTVHEDHSNATSPFIRIAVAVVKSDSPQPRPDPIVYLDGGPGGSTLETAHLVFEGWLGPFAQERDVILFDQRGIGKSEPALDCKALNNAFRQSVEQDIRREALADLNVTALTGCHAQLSERHDLSDYNSAQSAADLNELREALGYAEWNLYGISYGTRLALTAMRDHPQGIRSVILDSSYPAEADLYADIIPNAQRAFDTLFAGCAASSSCSSAFPDLESVFYGLIDKLNAQPAELDVTNKGTGETVHAKLNGDLFVSSVFSSLYDAGSIPFLPSMIYAANNGNQEVLKAFLGDLWFTFDSISWGMHYSVQCSEEVPFGSGEAYEAAAAAHPRIRYAFDTQPITRICQVWSVTPADPRENQPITSDIPTLVLAGEYDPITPPRWGEQVAAGLSRGYDYYFPGVGHGASVSDFCPYEMTLAFLSDPSFAPDSSCISYMGGPDFATEAPF
jgi:pimeloyl-ACP methyl ester carboxylesterase